MSPPARRSTASWRLAVLPEDEPFLPAGFATVGAGAHPLLRGFGKALVEPYGPANGPLPLHAVPEVSTRAALLEPTRATLTSSTAESRSTFATSTCRCSGASRCSPRSSARAAEWGARLDSDTIGVQIRTWRDYPRRYRKYHLPAVRRLAELLDAAPAKSRFLVVSDADEVIGDLEARYGAERVLHFPRATPRRESYGVADGTREDLIDMLLLARTRTLYASYLSTFSEVAWWLGGATANVAVF